MKRIWNCWLTHSWGLWAEVRQGEVTRGSDDSVVGFYIQQQRVCSCCGEIQLRITHAEAA